MGYGAADVYYQPEAFGLEQIAQVDLYEPCYSFDYAVVWRHEDGRLFYGFDSGCSCPSPFEDFTSLDDLTHLTRENWNEFKQEVLDRAQEGINGIDEFLTKVFKELH